MTLGGHGTKWPKSKQSEVRSQQVELFEQNICTFNLDMMGPVSFHLPHSPPMLSGYMKMLHDSLPHFGMSSAYDRPDTILSHLCMLHIGVNRWPASLYNTTLGITFNQQMDWVHAFMALEVQPTASLQDQIFLIHGELCTEINSLESIVTLIK